MRDTFNREIDYMRISITDRCNLRCRYCMPEEGIEKVSMDRILTYEEILRIAEAAVALGIRNFKVTGGEPLVRRGCAAFCKELKALPGVKQVTLTSNGQMLAQLMPELMDAGIDGINISLDSLKAERYKNITVNGDLKQTIEGIDAAIDSGIKTKINCLIQKDYNEDEVIDFADLAFDRGIDVRFIEIMPIGFGKPDTGLSNEIVLSKLRMKWPELSIDKTIRGNGPAVYYTLPDKSGSIGFISAMHGKFCEECNRIRLTSQGLIKPCLCFEDSVDLRHVLEKGNRESLVAALSEAIEKKPLGHSFENIDSVERRSMVEIGG